jgi:hypothetical protein
LGRSGTELGWRVIMPVTSAREGDGRKTVNLFAAKHRKDREKRPRTIHLHKRKRSRNFTRGPVSAGGRRPEVGGFRAAMRPAGHKSGTSGRLVLSVSSVKTDQEDFTCL